MISFNLDQPYVEDASTVKEAIKDAAKELAGIDVDDIKQKIEHQNDEFDAEQKLDSKGNPVKDANGNDIPVEDPGTYGRKIANVNTAVNAGSEGINKKMDDILNAMDPHRYNSRSIIARSRNSVFQFPVYITNTIRINEAHVIGKMFERVYATYVQTALNANPIVSEEDINDLVFLKQFHTNLKESGDLFVNEFYTPIDDLDQMMQESVFFQERVSDTMDVTFRWIPTTDNDLITENARLMNEPLSGLKYLMEVDTKQNRVVNLKDTNENMKEEKIPLTPEDLRGIARNRLKAGASNDEIKEEIDRLKEEIKNNKDPKYPYKWDGTRFYTYKLTRNKSQSSKDTIVTDTIPTPTRLVPNPPVLLHDNDIKKFNGLLPYTLEATFRVKPKEGPGYVCKFIIGVKTVLHIIRPQDLAEDLQGLVTGDIKSLRKVRYKTGEIKFNEYLFDIKNIKKNAAKRINGNKKFINTLTRLAEFNKLNGSLLKQPAKLINGEIPIPNASMVLSETDVAMLRNETGIDLSSVSNAKRLARALFLIAITIIDPSAGTMKVLFTDTDSDWDIQSIAAIDAEVSKTDNSAIMKELNKIINR